MAGCHVIGFTGFRYFQWAGSRLAIS